MQKLFYHSLLTFWTFKKVHAVILSKICIHTSNKLLIFTTKNKGSGSMIDKANMYFSSNMKSLVTMTNPALALQQ